MKLLIVDDEPLAVKRLSGLVAKLDNYQVVGSAGNGEEAIEQVKKLQPQVVLLDIEMPGMDGIKTAAEMQTMDCPPAIIFTTAYDQHALDAFQSGGQAYLLKPVDKKELQQTLERVSRLTQAQLQNNPITEPEGRDSMSISMGGNIKKIPLENIYYFKAEQKYVVIRHTEGEALTEEPLKALEQEFAQNFIRIHRSSLVAKDKISEMRRKKLRFYSVYLKELDQEMEVSRRHVAAVRKMLKSLFN